MSGIEDLKKFTTKCISYGYSDFQIKSVAKKDWQSLDSSTIDEVVEDVCSNHPNYSFIQKIVRSDLVCDVSGEDSIVYALDSEYCNTINLNRQRLFDLFGKGYDLKNKIRQCEFEYKPFDTGKILKKEDGTNIYNIYEPPEWQLKYFYSSGSVGIEKVKKMPKIYEDFLMHLVGGKKESFDYIVKWMANGIKSRNYCILATIGKQGIGKGVLSEIMRRIFGDSNFYAGADRMFKGTFNSQIANRRLVYCDEIFIKNKEEEDRVKLVVNDNVEIEKKGIDAKELPNYANFYVSSNNLDAISLTADDRRFSIVDLTSTKLIDVMDTTQIKSLLDQKNVNELAKFLWHYEVDSKEMMRVFVTETTKMVRSMGLKEWEEWFITEYCPENKGKRLKIKEASDVIKDNFGWSLNIGRGRFMELEKKYPKSFSVKRDCNGPKQVWVIDIQGELDA